MRRSALVVCVGLTIAVIAAGITWTPWAFLAVPFLVIAGYAMWLGLSNDQLLGALNDDPGAGPAGLH
jgi:hypothetical protein